MFLFCFALGSNQPQDRHTLNQGEYRSSLQGGHPDRHDPQVTIARLSAGNRLESCRTRGPAPSLFSTPLRTTPPLSRSRAECGWNRIPAHSRPSPTHQPAERGQRGQRGSWCQVSGAAPVFPELRGSTSNHRAPVASLTESRSWARLPPCVCNLWLPIGARPRRGPQPLPVKTASGKAGSTTLESRLGSWDQEGLCEKKACP